MSTTRYGKWSRLCALLDQVLESTLHETTRSIVVDMTHEAIDIANEYCHIDARQRSLGVTLAGTLRTQILDVLPKHELSLGERAAARGVWVTVRNIAAREAGLKQRKLTPAKAKQLKTDPLMLKILDLFDTMVSKGFEHKPPKQTKKKISRKSRSASKRAA